MSLHAPHRAPYTGFIFILTYCNTWWYLVCCNSRSLLWADEHINKLNRCIWYSCRLSVFCFYCSLKSLTTTRVELLDLFLIRKRSFIVRSFSGKFLPYMHSCQHRNCDCCSNITTSVNSEVMFIFPTLGHGKLSEVRGMLVIIFCQVLHLIIILVETISQKGLCCQHNCFFISFFTWVEGNSIALNGLSFFFIRSLNWIQSRLHWAFLFVYHIC